MKKRFVLIFLFFIVTPLFSLTELKYSVDENIIEIENYNIKNKPVCKDNIRIINDSNKKVVIVIYGKKEKQQEKELICKINVRPEDSQQEDVIKGLKNFKYIYVESDNENLIYKKITCEHNDMYIYISDNDKMEENEKDTEKLMYEFTSSDKDYSKIQAVVTVPNMSRDDLYDKLLQATVTIFNSSNFAIEYKEKSLGIIKGKSAFVKSTFMGSNKYTFVFTFDIKDNKYRIAFSDMYERDIFGSDKVDDEGEYKDIKEVAEELIKKINEEILASNNDDW